jgi:hypothetical protein
MIKMKPAHGVFVIKWVVILAVLYLGSFVIVWNPLSEVESRNVEFLPSGRLPVLGPKPRGWVRVLCAPRGSGFLFAKDYNGSEWIFCAYRYVIPVWARLRGLELVSD